jgi:hypothetical protein
MTSPGWLVQHQAGSGVALLRDHPGEVVRILCDHCDRAGRYRREALIARFGPAAGLPDTLWTLSVDCPRRGSISEPCGARYVGLGAKR